MEKYLRWEETLGRCLRSQGWVGTRGRILRIGFPVLYALRGPVGGSSAVTLDSALSPSFVTFCAMQRQKADRDDLGHESESRKQYTVNRVQKS